MQATVWGPETRWCRKPDTERPLTVTPWKEMPSTDTWVEVPGAARGLGGSGGGVQQAEDLTWPDWRLQSPRTHCQPRELSSTKLRPNTSESRCPSIPASHKPQSASLSLSVLGALPLCQVSPRGPGPHVRRPDGCWGQKLAPGLHAAHHRACSWCVPASRREPWAARDTLRAPQGMSSEVPPGVTRQARTTSQFLQQTHCKERDRMWTQVNTYLKNTLVGGNPLR